jgi:CRISPR-associated exonuclease Cas4
VYSEDDLLPLSGLQHLQFCERQWGLIHIEQVWEENRLTAEGRELHERAHEGGAESRPGVRIVRGLRLHSLRLGLAGEADVVEFHRDEGGAAMAGMEGRWRVFPVEYKRGRPKWDRSDEVQLCAQGLCLEEMFGTAVSGGALYYGQQRRRREVAFDGRLRAQTEALARRMQELYRARVTPAAVEEPKCERCSLIDVCLPGALGRRAPVERYLAKALRTDEETV